MADHPFADARPLAGRPPRRGHHRPSCDRFGVGRKAIDRLVRRRRAAPGHPRRLRRWRRHADARAPVPAAVLPPSRAASSPDRRPAMLGGLRRQPTLAALHFSIRHGVHLDHVAGVRFRQTTELGRATGRTGDDGIVVASWPRLAFDLAADLPPARPSLGRPPAARPAARHRRRVGGDRRRAVPSRPPREHDVPAQLLDLGDEPQDSHPEFVLLDALLAPGRPASRRRCPVDAGDGVTFHVDLGRRRRSVGSRARHPSRAPQRRRSPPGRRRVRSLARRATGRSSRSSELDMAPSSASPTSSPRSITDQRAAPSECRATPVERPSGTRSRSRHSGDGWLVDCAGMDYSDALARTSPTTSRTTRPGASTSPTTGADRPADVGDGRPTAHLSRSSTSPAPTARARRRR